MPGQHDTCHYTRAFLGLPFKKICFSSAPHRSCTLHMFDFSNLESILVFLLLWLLWLAGVNCV